MYISNIYKDRKIVPVGVVKKQEIYLKVYNITAEGKVLNQEDFDRGLEFAHTSICHASTFKNTKIGFLIQHVGTERLYLIYGYWSNENECFVKVFVDEPEKGGEWREAVKESFCVWDLIVISEERNLYVKNILSVEGEVDVSCYLQNMYSP